MKYASHSIPCLSLEQIQELDRLMIEEFDIPLKEMMESAGEHLAQFTAEFINARQLHALVCVGPGNNGGGGLVAALYLAQAGHRVTVVLAQPSSSMKEVPQQQLERVVNTGNIEVIRFNKSVRIPWSEYDVVIDALLGYSMHGELHKTIANIVERMNDDAQQIVSLDLPTGVWSEMEPGSLAVYADATLSLALPKTAACDHPEYTGEQYIADIGVPDELYTTLGVTMINPFLDTSIVKKS